MCNEIVNSTVDQFGLFIAGVVGFMTMVGTILGVLWLLQYIRPLLKKGNGLDLGA